MRRVVRAGCVVLAGLLPAVVSGAPCSGAVYLTFDTGNMAQAENIARILKQEKVQATFFLANEKTFRNDHALDDSWRDYWRARTAEGHAFGNHTYRHVYARQDLSGNQLRAQINYDGPMEKMTEAAFCTEFKKTDERFHAMTGQHLSGLWRAPGGLTTTQTIRWAANCGYPLHVHWDAAGFIGDELPSETHPNEKLLRQALARIQPGTVVMMHLGIWSRKDPAAPILEPLIQGLKARGLCIAPLQMATR